MTLLIMLTTGQLIIVLTQHTAATYCQPCHTTYKPSNGILGPLPKIRQGVNQDSDFYSSYQGTDHIKKVPQEIRLSIRVTVLIGL